MKLDIEPERALATVTGDDGRLWFRLRMLASLDTLDGPDETLRVESVDQWEHADHLRVRVRCASSRWRSRQTTLDWYGDRLECGTVVEGEGRLLNAHLFGGWRPPYGFLPSGSALGSVLSPNPDHPRRIVRPAVEPAVIGVVGDGGEPGVGRWLFTPAPWCYAVSREPPGPHGPNGLPDGRGPDGSPGDAGPDGLLEGTADGPLGGRQRIVPPAGRDGEWAAVGLLARIEEQTFTSFHYAAGTDGFSFRLDYEGQTAVDGEFQTPAVVVAFGQPGPYAALHRHRQLLTMLAHHRSPAMALHRQPPPMLAHQRSPTVSNRRQPPPMPARGQLPAALAHPREHRSAVPDHWLQPIFCGWGAQNHLAMTSGARPQDLATQHHYDGFLTGLAAHGVIPGTVVIDDKWQREYATCRADPAKWPDLRGWIARRHERGQRVLLWWKAWDVQGAPAAACVRTADGTPVALDPQAPACRRLIDDAVTYMLGPAGLDADGLKVDFTARTPSGTALVHAGSAWGAALLHRLLGEVYASAKAAKPDCLVITHTPNPAFEDVTDMIRLNDIRMLDAPDPDGPVVAQMAYRAAVVAAACPDLPVDTDGWCLPDRDSWAEYLAHQPGLGVPALYYATHIDHSGELLRADDLAAVARTWQRYRQRHGLPAPSA